MDEVTSPCGRKLRLGVVTSSTTKTGALFFPRPLGKHLGYPHRVKYCLPGLQDFNKRRDIRKRHFTVLVDICFWEKHASL